MAGQYDAAIAAYSKALEKRPNWKDAEENRELAKARAKLTEGRGGDLGDQREGADKVVFDQNKKDPQGQETEVAGDKAMSTEAMQSLWLRRVTTKPRIFSRRNLPSSIRPNKRELKSDRQLLRTGNAIFLVVVLVRRPRERGDSSTRTRTKDEEECARAYLHDPLAGGGDVLARSRRSGGHQGPRSESLHWAAASFFRRTTSSGSFGGAASFTIPQVPGTVIVKVGDPIVSSEQIEGESWFVQSHEFALFSQRDGSIEMPEFPVHFGTRKGFTGPVTEVDEKVPGFSIQIERPPRTDPNRFLITTESL